MLAITLRQPWANAVMFHGKDVENRVSLPRWQRAAGQRIAIHAGKRWDPAGAQAVDEIAEVYIGECMVEYGAIIGSVLVTDVHVVRPKGCCDPWGWEQHDDGMSRDPVVHLELAAPRPCRPIPYRGALGLWRVDPAVAREIEEGAR